MAGHTQVTTVFIKNEDFGEQLSEFAVCSFVASYVDPNELHGCQDIGGLWCIYFKTDNTSFVECDPKFKGRSIPIYPQNPYCTGADSPDEQFTKITVKDLPLSVHNQVLSDALKKEGVTMAMEIECARARDPDTNQLSNWYSGDRVIFAKKMQNNLNRFMQIGNFTCRVFHDGQQLKPMICTNCVQEGHTKDRCRSPPACRACKSLNHQAGDPTCEAYTTKQKLSSTDQTNQPLSNLYEADLKIFCMNFFCAEQAYLYSKAIQREQLGLADEILKATTISILKSKEKFLKYDPNWTTRSKKKLMKQILVAKAQQDVDFVDALISTAGTRIVFPSIHEFEWGTGLNQEVTTKTKRKFWPGKNLLGDLLEDIRSMLLSNALDREQQERSSNRLCGQKMVLPELHNPLEELNSFDLKELISELVCRNFNTGTYKGKALFKPHWWPNEVAWPYRQIYGNKGLMVHVVKACYEFYGLDSLLHGPKVLAAEPSRSTRLKVREEKGRRKTKKTEDQPLMSKENLKIDSKKDRAINGVTVKRKSAALPNRDNCILAQHTQHKRSSPKPKQINKLDFLNRLGLITETRAAHLSHERRPSELSSAELQILDEDVPHSPTPLSPSPAKSLISQLSRDASPFASQKRRYVDEDSDDSTNRDIRLPNSSRYFAIDLCSELGSRIAPHLNSLAKKSCPEEESDASDGVLSYEQYCHTPNKEVVMDKLRDRLVDGYQICYKKRVRYAHTYCFNRTQRRERRRVLRTGLSRQSRLLERSLKQCSVKLSKVSPKVVSMWRSPGKRPMITRPENEVIAISSDEESDVPKRKKVSPPVASIPAKRPSVTKPAMLFRCHLCNASLTCVDNARQVIQGHFRNLHKVFNIDLIEHQDAHNNKVMSIVEVPLAPPQVSSATSLWQNPSNNVVDLTEDDDDVVVLPSKPLNAVNRQLFR